MNEQVFILWRCDDGSIERKKGLRMFQFFGQLWWLKAQVVLVEHSITETTVLIPKGVGLFLSYDVRGEPTGEPSFELWTFVGQLNDKECSLF